MKRAMIIPSGAADEPVEALDGQTPLAAAETPNMDRIAMNGRQGRVTTIPEGVLAGTEIALLSLLGYDPEKDAIAYGPLEAAGQGLAVRRDEIVCCTSFLTVVDGLVVDDATGLSVAEADKLIADLNNLVEDEHCRFHRCDNNRALLVMSGAPANVPRCLPPHQIRGKLITGHSPRGKGADRIKHIMERAHALLAEHEVNLVRSDLGENPATDIWLWGAGGPRGVMRFSERFGVSAAVVASTGVVRGLARATRMTVATPPDVGGSDNACHGCSEAAIAALEHHDLVIVHAPGPARAGYSGNVGAKVEAIECIDQQIVGPVLTALEANKEWKILVVVDHPVTVHSHVLSAAPAPFCMAGYGLQTVLNRPFSEESAAASDLQVDPGFELMEFFLKR